MNETAGMCLPRSHVDLVVHQLPTHTPSISHEFLPEPYLMVSRSVPKPTTLNEWKAGITKNWARLTQRLNNEPPITLAAAVYAQASEEHVTDPGAMVSEALEPFNRLHNRVTIIITGIYRWMGCTDLWKDAEQLCCDVQDVVDLLQDLLCSALSGRLEYQLDRMGRQVAKNELPMSKFMFSNSQEDSDSLVSSRSSEDSSMSNKGSSHEGSSSGMDESSSDHSMSVLARADNGHDILSTDAKQGAKAKCVGLDLRMRAKTRLLYCPSNQSTSHNAVLDDFTGVNLSWLNGPTLEEENSDSNSEDEGIAAMDPGASTEDNAIQQDDPHFCDWLPLTWDFLEEMFQDEHP
ncbi:hypothetical protein ARMGADRAFT_1088064 [Armillaria gallica]|uniref:Uncharacterized protein n=1 Tax=Armillaria gallica TaxID=47427 RepID=A0A2H3CPG2_ARMGA|nr:hypothetical protein ARMGADRAFT_1088064 [Armillaria gallica]